jgi:hypothetical protein
MPSTRFKRDLDELRFVLEDAIDEEELTYPEAADRFGCTERHLRRVRRGGYPEAAAKYLRKLGYKVDLYAEVEAP